jgi:hypothetical protein
VTVAIVGSGVAAADAAPKRVVADGHAGNVFHERQLSGQLQLDGAGLITLTGRLAISANLRSPAVLRLVDRAGDASVYVAGRPLRFNRHRRALVRPARGIIFASGSNLTLQVSGGRVEMSAAGVGRALLRGKGDVRVNLGPPRVWPRGAINLRPVAPPRPRKSPNPPGKSRGR